ncbi:MAG TPA: hypothetical protein VK673_21355 [Chthoniobacterales bacterium]|nr:hypothetical protein [Chthoniobacterales bacterium]
MYQQLPVYEIASHHARRIGCDPRCLSRLVSRGVRRAVAMTSEGALLFNASDAELNRAAIMQDGFRIRTLSEQEQADRKAMLNKIQGVVAR